MTFKKVKNKHMKLDHIGIAVKSLEKSNALFSALLNAAPYKEETVAGQHVQVSFFKTGESKIELLEPTSEQSAIGSFIEKRGEGIHHMAFLVDDIYAEIERLKAAGFQPLMDAPRDGADNKLVFFFHPKTTNGVLVELCQKKK